MAANAQDPIKTVFTQVNRALLVVLANSDFHEIDKLRSSIELEIADLSRSIAQCFDNNTIRSLSTRLHDCSDAHQQIDAVALPSQICDWSTPAEQWSDCNLSSCPEPLQYPTPVSTQWANGDTDESTLRSTNGSGAPAIWSPTSQSDSAHPTNSESPSSILSDFGPNIELTDDFPDVSMVLEMRSELDDISSEQRSTCCMRQAPCCHSCDSEKHDEQVLEGGRASVFVNGGSFGSFSTQVSAFDTSDLSTGDRADFMQIDVNSQQKSTRLTRWSTTHKPEHINKPRRGRRHYDNNTSINSYEYVRMQGLLRNFVTTDRDHVIDLLSRLTHVIGNADSLIQLKASIGVAREKDNITSSSQYGAHDLAHTVRVLDMLDTVSHRSSLLRRYYLVRLLRHRLKSEADHHKDKEGLKLHVSKTKHIAGTKRSSRAVRADSQALIDMMKLLYPNLKGPTSVTTDDSKNYQRLLLKLKNRLACARNWHQFAEHFSIGILAVIPSGSKSGVPSDQIEKLPVSIIASYLDFLKQVKGPFLKSIAMTLSGHVFEILGAGGAVGGSGSSPSYKFEQCDDTDVLQVDGNQKLLQDLCSIAED